MAEHEEDLFWLTVSEVSVHVSLLCGFGPVLAQSSVVGTLPEEAWSPYEKQEEGVRVGPLKSTVLVA